MKRPRVETIVLIYHYNRGATLRELAGHYGIAFQAIAQRLERAGVPRRRCWRWRKKFPFA